MLKLNTLYKSKGSGSTTRYRIVKITNTRIFYEYGDFQRGTFFTGGRSDTSFASFEDALMVCRGTIKEIR